MLQNNSGNNIFQETGPWASFIPTAIHPQLGLPPVIIYVFFWPHFPIFSPWQKGYFGGQFHPLKKQAPPSGSVEKPRCTSECTKRGLSAGRCNLKTAFHPEMERIEF